jgi:hypothetical protein
LPAAAAEADDHAHRSTEVLPLSVDSGALKRKGLPTFRRWNVDSDSTSYCCAAGDASSEK